MNDQGDIRGSDQWKENCHFPCYMKSDHEFPIPY